MPQAQPLGDGSFVCGGSDGCGSEVPAPAPYQSGMNNKWYLRQVCPGCGAMFVNQGPYSSAAECPGRAFTTGPGK